jgi:hypothetical protein
MGTKCRDREKALNSQRRWALIRNMVYDRYHVRRYDKEMEFKEDYNYGLGEDVTYYHKDEDSTALYNQSQHDENKREAETPWYLIKKDNKMLYLFNMLLVIATWMSLFLAPLAAVFSCRT